MMVTHTDTHKLRQLGSSSLLSQRNCKESVHLIGIAASTAFVTAALQRCHHAVAHTCRQRQLYADFLDGQMRGQHVRPCF